jgi:hypothetical protein
VPYVLFGHGAIVQKGLEGGRAAQEKGYPPEILVPPMTFLKFYSEVGQPIQLPLTDGDTPVLDHEKFKVPWAQLSTTDGDLGVGDPVPNFLLMAEKSKAEYDAMKTFDWGMEAVSPGVGEEGWYLCTCTCTDPDDPRMCPTPDLFKQDGKYPQGEGDYGAMSEALKHKCDGILGRYGGNELHWVACTLVAFSDAEQMQDMPVLTTAQTGVGLDPAQLNDIREAIGTSKEILASLGDGQVVNFAVGTDDTGKPETACVLLGDEHDPKVNDYVRGRSTIWDGQLRNSGGKFVVSGPAGKPQELLDSLAKVMGPRYANAFVYKSSIFGDRG